MKRFLYGLWQWTWGLPQTLAGLVLFIIYRKRRHVRYHGAVVTFWDKPYSVSLGMFLFVSRLPFRDRRGVLPEKEMPRRLLVHEYGHTIQSLLLGPLFLPVIGLPSVLWAGLPVFQRMRDRGTPYSRCFTESWANRWGEKVTGEKSLEDAV